MVRHGLAILIAAGIGLTGGSAMAQAPAQTPAEPKAGAPSLPPFVQRGMPGEYHAALKPLEGRWRAAKQLFIAVGTPENPASSDRITTTRTWIGGGRHLLDITEGTIAGGSYYRLGVLGFSTIDRAYEWATFDGLNANSMLYRSAPLDRVNPTIVLSGTFTDQGLLGEESAGKSIGMRTVISIDGPDSHTIELRFDVPGGRQDMLIDRTVYTRLKE